MAAWNNVARKVQEATHTVVDWEEEYFTCPECGEPVYKLDWQEEDYFMGHYYVNTIWCPDCGAELYCENPFDEE